MDPDAVLVRLLTAFTFAGTTNEAEERSEALSAMRDLSAWLKKGGFFPTVHEVCPGLPVGRFEVGDLG